MHKCTVYIVVIIAAQICCLLCDESTDNIFPGDDSSLNFLSDIRDDRLLGFQPTRVSTRRALSRAISKGDHYKQLTGKHHTILSELCSRRTSKGGWSYMPFHGSCNQYIHCNRGGAGYIETCAVGTFFNGRKCVRSEDVDCPFDPCRKFTNGYHYTDGQTCYGYYKCLHGKSVSGICPSGSAFNGIRQTCLPDPTCVQPSGYHHPCFAGTSLPFPGQPHMFYLWDGYDSVTEMQCPRGLWYNPHVCACDWVIPGQLPAQQACSPMFHFDYSGSYLEEFNKVPQSPNDKVSIYRKSALFSEGGQILVWMMNDIDMDSEWALCFEFFTQRHDGEVALLSNDWNNIPFTYKITHIPAQDLVLGYFRMKDGTVAELIVIGVQPKTPHFVRVAKLGSVMKMRVDNMPPAAVTIGAGVASAPSPLVVGQASECHGFVGYFDELKFFRCVPKDFFDDYDGY